MAPTPLDAVLDELFGADAPTNVAQAAKIGVDAALLSRVRNGKTRLSETFVEKIVNGLNPDAVLRPVYTTRLLNAADHSGQDSVGFASIKQAVDLLRRLSSPGSALCIEYRDNPRATKTQKYSWMTQPVGAAVAAGMHLAMFQPFGTFHGRHHRAAQNCPRSVDAYQYGLISKVEEVYRQMCGVVREQCAALKADPEPASKRIVLYERNQPPSGFGFQSRLFCARPKDAEIEVWEWISTPQEDLFVRREGLDEEVVYQQFFEVTAFFETHGRLPTTNPELWKDKAACDFMKTWGVRTNPHHWTVYGPDTNNTNGRKHKS